MFIITYSSAFESLLPSSFKTAITKITCDILKGGCACERRASYLYEELHENPEVDRVGTSEHRLEEPGEQAQVVSAVLIQPVRIPPHVTYTDVTGETPPDVDALLGLFTRDTEHPRPSVTLPGHHIQDSPLVLPLGKDLGALSA